MLTEIEKQLIFYAAGSEQPFFALQFLESNPGFKTWTVYAALRRLDAEGYLSSVKEIREKGSTLPIKRLYEATEAVRHIAKGLKMLAK